MCKFAKAAFYFFGTVGALTLLVGGLVHFANKPRPVVSTLAVSGASLADQLHVEPITRTLRSGESVKFFIIENRTAKPIMIKDVMFNREFHAIRGASNLEYFGPSPYTPWPLTLYPEERAFAFVRSTVRLHASWNGPPRVTELRIMTDKGDADFAVNE